MKCPTCDNILKVGGEGETKFFYCPNCDKTKEFNLGDKKEIDEVLSGHGLNKSFRKHIISLFERKEKEFIRLLKKYFTSRQSRAFIDKLAGELTSSEPQTKEDEE